MIRTFILINSITALLLSCSTVKYNNISYSENNENLSNKLNVFTPKDKFKELRPVMIFVYGGNWNSGNKGLYAKIGRNFAKKGIITVIPNYTKSPKVAYDSMSTEIASAIKWTQKNIHTYGGDHQDLYLSGHSAGGHLASLAVLDSSFKINPKEVKGIVLIDAAGLDMYTYLRKNPPTKKNDYLSTWTDDPEEWKKASPITYLTSSAPRFLIYIGTKTYPSIKSSNQRFLKKLNSLKRDNSPFYLNKKHIPMVTQFLKSNSLRYDEILEFMKK